MHVHFLGICGTFMGGLSILASKMGHKVTGQDLLVYPPISTQLKEHNIDIYKGYELDGLPNGADLIVIGNVMRRGMPVIEYLLEQNRLLISGPEFLYKYILQDKYTLVVSGTHGKTTTTSMLAWILEYAGLEPGFLIGGIPKNFNVSARISNSKYFVIEGDEYDSAFFDKRSKFIHYKPNVLIINNIEFDHADIFKNIAAIQDQFHHVIRTVPSSGCVIVPEKDPMVAEVLERGCWSNLKHFAIDNNASIKEWPFFGQFNYLNAFAAITAASFMGIDIATAAQALTKFAGVKRRLEQIANFGDIYIYDDFAHHPTAIECTLQALRANIKDQGRILAVLDICSNTMRSGENKNRLAAATDIADSVYFYHDKPIAWDITNTLNALHKKTQGVFTQSDTLIDKLLEEVQVGDHVVLMSNGAFAGIHNKLIEALAKLHQKSMAID